MSRALLAFIAAVLTALVTFFLIYIGTQSFDYSEDDYLDRNGEYVELRPWILAPIQARELIEKYPGRPVIALGIAVIAALLSTGIAAISTETHSPTRGLAAFIAGTFLGFLGFTLGVQYLGFQLWGFEMLLALSLSSGLSGYMMAATPSTEGVMAHVGNIVLVTFATGLAILTTPILRLLNVG
jgi:hypothetical protein